jgi:hypothetical protein
MTSTPASDSQKHNMEEEQLVAQASSWCASHGVLMGARDGTTRQPMGDWLYEPAPFSLYPTTFSKKAFDQAYAMAQPFAHVVHAAAENHEHQGAKKCDCTIICYLVI